MSFCLCTVQAEVDGAIVAREMVGHNESTLKTIQRETTHKLTSLVIDFFFFENECVVVFFLAGFYHSYVVTKRIAWCVCIYLCASF